ncbi:hypothetical protein KM043_004974 [Ampulex compressa]|nr:hypothetical protein KM043_004974 [Ampulex compressa]
MRVAPRQDEEGGRGRRCRRRGQRKGERDDEEEEKEKEEEEEEGTLASPGMPADHERCRNRPDLPREPSSVYRSN